VLKYVRFTGDVMPEDFDEELEEDDAGKQPWESTFEEG